MSIHDALSAQQYNASFLEKIATVEGQAQLTEAGRQYVKTELQESAFSRAILPQEPISTSDCQRNIHDNSLYLIRDIEPGVSALGVDNLGEPDGNYIRGERYTIPIVNFATKRFQITVEDLRAYQYKITKRIEDKSVPILERLEDQFFLRIIGAAARISNKVVAGGTKQMKTGLPQIDPTDHIHLKNVLQAGINGGATKKLECAAMLMTNETYETVVMLPSHGDDFGKDRVLNGITSDTVYGTRVIRTIKSDLLPNGHVWAFTTPDFLGHNFALGEPTFEIKSNFGLIEWQTKESIGMNVGNVQAAALLTMQGSSTPGTLIQPVTSGGAQGYGDLCIGGTRNAAGEEITARTVSDICDYYTNLRV